MPQVESFDGDLVECPKCGTFLEAEDADTHAATHRKNSPSSRDRNPVSRTSPTEPPRPANGSYQSTRETNEVSSSAMNGAAKATAAPVEGPVSRLAQLLQVSPSAATSRSILCDSRLQLTLDNVDSPTTWACGYRNLQMLLSVLLAKDPTAAPAMLHRTGSRGVPDIATIQKTLEDAWKSGIDAVGAEHFFGKLVGKREWIGATDVAAFLIHLGVRPIIFDFHRPTDPEGNHPLLLDFVRDHFERRAGNETGKVVQTNAFPLYFQHQGHSRTIVGFESNPTSFNLLVVDPGRTKPTQLADYRVSEWEIRKHRQYQIVTINGWFDTEDEKRAAGKVLRSIRKPE